MLTSTVYLECYVIAANFIKISDICLRSKIFSHPSKGWPGYEKSRRKPHNTGPQKNSTESEKSWPYIQKFGQIKFIRTLGTAIPLFFFSAMELLLNL